LVKSRGSRAEVPASAKLFFGDDAFRLDLAPCYSVTGALQPKGRRGDKFRLLPDESSAATYRAFMTRFAATAGADPGAPLRDRTKLLLTIEGGSSATLAIKTRLVPKPGRKARIKAELTGPIENTGTTPVPEPCRFAGPPSSQPLALTAIGDFLAVANPDSDTVSLFDVRPGREQRLAELAVQDEPNGVAFLPGGSKLYVANTVSGTVSVIETDLANGTAAPPALHIPVGTEPYALVPTPNGGKLYVANARSANISVIDTATDSVVATIPNVGREPRGLAVSNDGDADDGDETLYVTQFLALLDPGKIDGADDAKSGRLTTVATATDTVSGTISIPPLADSGFAARGDALARIPPSQTATFGSGAYPNQLNQVALKGGFVYVPSTGASPNGPPRFDNNLHSLLSFFDAAGAGAASVNLQLGVASQASPVRRFLSVPWALAFEHLSDAGFVVSSASDVVAKVAVDPATGAPTLELDPSDPGRVLELAVGKNPRGIVVDAADTRAYVMNYVSRDVTVLDLSASPEKAVAALESTALPAPGSPEHRVQVGRELYYTSIGRFDPPAPGEPPVVGRMSREGWGSCGGCHPFGLSDGVVWILDDGPRRTLAQHVDFDPSDPLRLIQRVLNASAARDEEEDFEIDIRGLSGGEGLIVIPGTALLETEVFPLLPLASGGREQLLVGGQPAWDALKAYVQFGIRAPISPESDLDPGVLAGRSLFIAANCQLCHGGAQWTRSTLSFTPPPDPGLVEAQQLVAQLRQVGTFDPVGFNEVDANAQTPLGADGYAVPSLLSVFAFEGTLLHGGGAQTIDDVLQNVLHRSAGTGGVDTLTNAADRAFVAKFVRSIDAGTTPILF
jgi:YVTN family beta-propeller protein